MYNLSYETYVTDALMGLAQGKAPKDRWYDITIKEREKPIDGDAIVKDVIRRAGLVVT